MLGLNKQSTEIQANSFLYVLDSEAEHASVPTRLSEDDSKEYGKGVTALDKYFVSGQNVI